MPSRPPSPAQLAAQIRAYLGALTPDSRRALQELRAVIESAAPSAEQGFSYRIPAYRHGGRVLLWCAGWKDHVSVYPITPAMHEAGGADISKYVAGKGTLRFEIGKPLPVKFIRRIVRARVAEIDAGWQAP